MHTGPLSPETIQAAEAVADITARIKNLDRQMEAEEGEAEKYRLEAEHHMKEAQRLRRLRDSYASLLKQANPKVGIIQPGSLETRST